MLDETTFDALEINLDRKFNLHKDVLVYVRDGAAATIAPLTIATKGWCYYDEADAGYTFRFVHPPKGPLTEAQFEKVASFVVYRRGVGVDAPKLLANGTRRLWREASSRVAVAAGYKEAGTYVAPTGPGFGFTFDFDFELS